MPGWGVPLPGEQRMMFGPKLSVLERLGDDFFPDPVKASSKSNLAKAGLFNFNASIHQ